MSFLDRVTKAVSGTVDRGKKEVDQFMRIQRVKGEIGTAERAIEEAKARIQQVTLQIGGRALEMLRAGTMTSPELQTFVDQIGEVEKQIAGQEGIIVEKKAEIEKIKAEDDEPRAGEPAPVVDAVPPPVPADETAPSTAPVVDAVPPPPMPSGPAAPATAAGVRVCPACGHQVSGTAAFCGECGTKIA